MPFFSFYLNIRWLRKGRGKFFTGVLERIFLSVKVWERWTMICISCMNWNATFFILLSLAAHFDRLFHCSTSETSSSWYTFWKCRISRSVKKPLKSFDILALYKFDYYYYDYYTDLYHCIERYLTSAGSEKVVENFSLGSWKVQDFFLSVKEWELCENVESRNIVAFV